MTTSLSGKTVAITGGARGIGFATAKAFLAAGARVAIGDIDAQLAVLSAREVGCLGLPLDVTDAVSFEEFLDRVEGEFGPLDILINNAGIMPLGPLAEEPESVSRRIVEINLLGALNGTKLAVSRMVPRGRGHIINISSAVGRVAVPNAATYSATKHAVVGLSQAVRHETHGTGVEVSIVLPTVTQTELVSGVRPVKGQPSVEPGDVAAVIVGVARRPVFETWVPKSAQHSTRAIALLPHTWQEKLLRKSGALDGLASVDHGQRAAYEGRVRS